MLSPDFVLQLLVAIAAAAGVYAAIRADLTKAIITAEHARESATNAHIRLNEHITLKH